MAQVTHFSDTFSCLYWAATILMSECKTLSKLTSICCYVAKFWYFSYPLRRDWTAIVESLLSAFPLIRLETVAVDIAVSFWS